MGPKTEKKRMSQYETGISLSDPINTEEWKCAVVFLKESTDQDTPLIQIFAEESSKNARKEIKTIDFERDIMKFLKNFISGEIGMKDSFLLNFSDIFEAAGQYVKSMNNLPVSLIVKIVKAFIFKLKKDGEQEKTVRMFCHNNPIEIMAEKPLIPLYGKEEIEQMDDDKVQSEKKKPVKNGATNAVKIKLHTPFKEDTKLLRRGENVRETIIDDIPDNSFFHLYIALTGFQNPDLVLEMLNNEIPLYGVFCLQSSHPIKEISSSSLTDLDIFWEEFLELLWRPDLTSIYKDVVFLVYNPPQLPQNEKELRSFIFREISFLMYDLSDIKHQLSLYLRHMRLWKVDESSEIINSLSHELDELPQECFNIPIMMQNMLDTLCREDEEKKEEDEEEEEEDDDDEEESANEKISRNNSSFSITSSNIRIPPESETSYGSLLPLISTVKLPTPRWSTIVDTDEKLLLYNKMITLDHLYDLGDDSEKSNLEPKNLIFNLYSVKRRRPYCKNLDMEIENHSLGLLGKLWMNYPKDEKDDKSNINNLTSKLNYPELTVNYFIYLIWITRIQEMTKEIHENVSVNVDEIMNNSQTKFTVTDGSRMALNKMNRPSNFFSPSHLKIISSEMLSSLSAPQFRSSPKFSWTKKSFVSDFHIPIKYITGEPMGVLDDLENYLKENSFSQMKDYNFIEMMNKQDLIERIEEIIPNYDIIHHTYSPLTDSIYIIMYNKPSMNGIQREIHNVMLTTPIGLRDFYNYIIDDEKDWLNQQIINNDFNKTYLNCSDTMFNPIPNFRGFTEFDFWLENSIKYINHEGIIIKSDSHNFDSSQSNIKKSSQEKYPSLIKSKSSIYAEIEDSYKFVGFDFEPGAIQFSEVNTTFKGSDNCYIRASLQEQLYGKQLLGIHIQQSGHNLHLYSYVCPIPHLDEPYTFHIEYKNGTILAFSRRIISNDSISMEGSNSSLLQDENFIYDMKISFPHGLTITTVKEYINPYYIKQSYRENSSTVSKNEKSRLFLPNGNIIIMLTDNTVKIFKPDTSIIIASLDDLVSSSSIDDENGEKNNFQQLSFHSYTKITPEGYQLTVVNDEIIDDKEYQTFIKTEKETQKTYYKRSDGTSYVIMENYSICVEFTDGSKIYTIIQEEELYIEEESNLIGEDSTENIYNLVQRKIIMEHPNYATIIYETKNQICKLIFPWNSEIEIDSNECYQVRLDHQTQLKINMKEIRMWRYNQKNKLLMSTIVNLNVFEKNQKNNFYCKTIDYHGRQFVIEANGNCYTIENDNNLDNYSNISINKNQSEDINKLKRYFVVNRDLTGFEIIHKKKIEKEIKKKESQLIIHCEKLKTSPSTRYFAILKEMQNDYKNKWTIESITPKTKYKPMNVTLRSTYGLYPTWMHPFPKKKPKLITPEILHGRILLEIYPTDCPDPIISEDIIKYDINDLPETKISLNENVNMIIKKVANQDQEILREIYYVAMRERTKSKEIHLKNESKMEKLLQMSKFHMNRRNYLKNCIHYKIVPCYFDTPHGIAWLIIISIIESIEKNEKNKKDELFHITNIIESSTESSEMEYNIEWSTDPSYSDLSYRSRISNETAPEMSKLKNCKRFYPSPRNVKSEPIYKIHQFSTKNDNFGDDLNIPSSENCYFTSEDIHTLEKRISSKDFESKPEIYQLEDLINLGLV